jgi:hypothetical protein
LNAESRAVVAGDAPIDAATKPIGERTPTGADRASFPLDEVGAQALIDFLGPRWRDMTRFIDRADSFTGGHALGFVARDRSAAVHTFADGKVWNLQLRSGMGNRCGSAAMLEPLLGPVLRKLAPSSTLTAPQRSVLIDALKDRQSGDPVEIGEVRIAATGGCIVTLDVRTISRGTG